MGLKRFIGDRIAHDSDRLQGRAPRVLERIAAVLMVAVALEFIGEVVFDEWFYFRYHRDYAYTLDIRVSEWIYALQVLLLAFWLLGLAWSLLHGDDARRDRGLFGPTALRIWGAGFAFVELALLLRLPESLLHYHLLLWFAAASAACFALAGRRARMAREARAAAHAPSSGPPRPIG